MCIQFFRPSATGRMQTPLRQRYVGATVGSSHSFVKEVWVTAPRDKSVRILDSQTLTQKEKLTFEDQPEGYAVDAKRGRLYMNYEDKDLTTAVDLKTRKTVARWPSSTRYATFLSPGIGTITNSSNRER
jgi:DNA-binding beta-propeller fold protein YncE